MFIFLLILLRFSLKPVDISYFTEYIEKNTNLNKYFHDFQIQKIQVKVNILSNKVNFNLGKINLENQDNIVQKFYAEKISLDILISDLLKYNIDINTLNISDGEISLVLDDVESSKNSINVNSVIKPIFSNLDVSLFNNILLNNLSLKLIDKTEKEIEANIEKGSISFNEDFFIIDNFKLNNIEYSDKRMNKEASANNILISYLEEDNYLISSDSLSISGINQNYNKYLILPEALKFEECNIKIDMKDKSLKAKIKIFQNNNLLPLQFDGNIEKNFILEGKLEGKIIDSNFVKILNDEKFISLGLNIEKIKSGKSNGNFTADISNNKINSVDFAVKYSLEEFAPLLFSKANFQETEINLKELYVLGKYENNKVKLLDFNANFKEGKISIYGDIENVNSELEYALVLTMHDFSFKNFKAQKETNYFKKFNKNLEQILLEEITINNFVIEMERYDNKIKINSLLCELGQLKLEIQNDFQLIIENLKANGDDKIIEISFDKANFYNNQGPKIELFRNKIDIIYNSTDLDNYEITYASNFNSEYKDLKKIIKSFKLTDFEGYFIDRLNGKLETSFSLLAKNNEAEKDFLEIEFAGELKNFYTVREEAKVDFPLNLNSFNGKFNIINNKFTLDGIGLLNGSEVDLTLNVNEDRSMQAKILSDAKYNAFNFLNEFNFLSGGKTKLEMLITKENISDAKWKASVINDLYESSVKIDLISYKKPIKEKGQMKADFYFRGFTLLNVEKLHFAANDILINIDMNYSESGNLKQIKFNEFFYKNNKLYGSFKNLSSNKKLIVIRGESFDFENLPIKSNNSNKNAYYIDLSINNFLYGKNNFGKTKLKAELSDDVLKSLSGTLTNQNIEHTEFELQATPLQNKDTIKFSFNDFGLFLRTLGITDDFVSGKGELLVNVDNKNKKIKDGKYNIKEFSIKNASFLTRILQLASFTGLLEILGNEGIPFNNLRGEFDKKNSTINLKDTRFEGLSLGATVKGTLNLDNNNINLEGVLVPAYAINAILNKIPLIGDIMTGVEGEGVIGVEYKAEGNYENPVYSINPLSIFTPGILRNLFDPFQNTVPAN